MDWANNCPVFHWPCSRAVDGLTYFITTSRAAVPVNYAANSLLTPNLHLHTKNIKQKIHTLGTLCNPLFKKPTYTTLPPPLHPPHRALVPYRPFPLTYEQHTETSTTRKILGFRQHRFFFFTRLANFYSVAKKSSNFAILKTEYFSEKLVKPSIDKPSTFLEKGKNRVK